MSFNKLTHNDKNLLWHNFNISKKQRAEIKKQKPCIIWFTGLSGSGKSTLGNLLEKRLYELGYHTYLLDGDNVRHGLSSDLGFNKKSRVENIRRVGEVAKLFVDSGSIVLAAFISPFLEDRQIVRDLVEKDEFIEIYVNVSLEVCEKRDPKGLYKKARAGEIDDFTGISSPYEKPIKPDINIRNDKIDINKNIDKIILYLKERGYLDA
ncbi:MAG: adenylyl-sulfate kinase [Sulfurimonas sp.]|nr:adenylyl-sulfate kinase [Sulfurimonas sp.]